MSQCDSVYGFCVRVMSPYSMLETLLCFRKYFAVVSIEKLTGNFLLWRFGYWQRFFLSLVEGSAQVKVVVMVVAAEVWKMADLPDSYFHVFQVHRKSDEMSIFWRQYFRCLWRSFSQVDMVPAQVKVVVGYLHTVVFILTEVLCFLCFRHMRWASFGTSTLRVIGCLFRVLLWSPHK